MPAKAKNDTAATAAEKDDTAAAESVTEDATPTLSAAKASLKAMVKDVLAAAKIRAAAVHDLAAKIAAIEVLVSAVPALLWRTAGSSDNPYSLHEYLREQGLDVTEPDSQSLRRVGRVLLVLDGLKVDGSVSPSAIEYLHRVIDPGRNRSTDEQREKVRKTWKAATNRDGKTTIIKVRETLANLYPDMVDAKTGPAQGSEQRGGRAGTGSNGSGSSGSSGGSGSSGSSSAGETATVPAVSDASRGAVKTAITRGLSRMTRGLDDDAAAIVASETLDVIEWTANLAVKYGTAAVLEVVQAMTSTENDDDK